MGYLVGQESRGLEYMFIMMNSARYAVGMQGIAIAERAYQHAVAYAKDRVHPRCGRKIFDVAAACVDSAPGLVQIGMRVVPVELGRVNWLIWRCLLGPRKRLFIVSWFVDRVPYAPFRSAASLLAPAIPMFTASLTPHALSA
nr:hypothetical protein [Variovorax sp. W1I1]